MVSKEDMFLRKVGLIMTTFILDVYVWHTDVCVWHTEVCALN